MGKITRNEIINALRKKCHELETSLQFERKLKCDLLKKLTTIGQLANCANCAEFSETLIRWDDENDPYVVVDCEKNINDKVNFDPCKNWNKE